MLYKATQTVIEKAPIDAVTILCKNTLAEERLLKNRVEHEVLVCYIYSISMFGIDYKSIMKCTQKMQYFFQF